VKASELIEDLEKIMEDTGRDPIVCVYSHSGINGPVTVVSETVPGRIEIHRVDYTGPCAECGQSSCECDKLVEERVS
jgi:hypothetical protein